MFDYLVFGYKLNGNRSCCFWNGLRFGTDTRRGCFLLAIYNFIDDLKRRPWRARLAIADVLMRCAMRLRGEPVSVFGFYDIWKGNEAARIVDSIETKMLLEMESDDFQDLRDELSRLASLASATCTRNFEE